MDAHMDERSPLLRAGSPGTQLERNDLDPGKHSASSDTDIVDFDPEGDPDNPIEWPSWFKWSIVALLALMAFTVTFTCISVVPVANRIAYDLSGGASDKFASILLVTIWELGEAAGPLLIAPLSEVYGRYPVMNAANGLFVAATILAAVCEKMPLFIVARALTGLAVASNVLNPAIIGDMFVSEERGSPMSLIMLAPLIGGAVGPAIGGAVAQTLGWRGVLLMAAGMAGACQVLFLVCFRETYKVPILRRRAARLQAEYGTVKLAPAVRVDAGAIEETRSSEKLWASVMRPAIVLSGSGVLMALSLFGSVAYSCFYILAVSLPDILENTYDVPPALTGSGFMCFSVGALTGILVCNRTLDKIYITLRNTKPTGQPEFRLPLTIAGGFALCLSLALYGWAAQLHLPLQFFLLSVSLIGFSLMLAFLPLMAYVVDAFGLFSASAMTGIIVTRCLMGTFLPLAVPPLVNHMGYGWGFSALSAVCLLLAPIPILVMRYGSRWRQKSKYSKDV